MANQAFDFIKSVAAIDPKDGGPILEGLVRQARSVLRHLSGDVEICEQCETRAMTMQDEGRATECLVCDFCGHEQPSKSEIQEGDPIYCSNCGENAETVRNAAVAGGLDDPEHASCCEMLDEELA